MQRVSFLLTIIVVSASAASAADLDSITEGCNGCHGDNGVSQSNDVPTIAGLSQYYQADQLYYFKEKERECRESKYRQGDTNRPATNMCEIAAGLSEPDVDALAAHYAKLPFVPAKQDFDAALAATGKVIHDGACEKCHADGGTSIDDDAGILAGQRTGYLEYEIAQFRADERYQLDTMKEKIQALSDSDVKALLQYYASQQ